MKLRRLFSSVRGLISNWKVPEICIEVEPRQRTLQARRASTKVSEAFHTYMLRKTLLTCGSMAFALGFNTTLRDPIIRNTAASLLYIDLISLLDDALHERMTPEEYDRGRRTGNRLEMLNKRGDLINGKEILQINKRRNEISHEFGNGATVEELEKALEIVRMQLISWGHVKQTGEYTLEGGRERIPEAEDENTILAFKVYIHVKLGEKIYFELNQVQKHGRISAP